VPNGRTGWEQVISQAHAAVRLLGNPCLEEMGTRAAPHDEKST
jgi:hypothetical protein